MGHRRSSSISNYYNCLHSKSCCTCRLLWYDQSRYLEERSFSVQNWCKKLTNFISLQRIHENKDENSIVVILGLKIDLKDQIRVNPIEVKQFCQKNGYFCYFASSKSRKNVKETVSLIYHHIHPSFFKLTPPTAPLEPLPNYTPKSWFTCIMS